MGPVFADDQQWVARRVRDAHHFPDMATRAVPSHRAGECHARGELRPVIPAAGAAQSKATGTPKMTHHELVGTAVQMMIPLSRHADGVGSVRGRRQMGGQADSQNRH